jgi:hypothetical protein
MAPLTIWDLADDCGNVTKAHVARVYGVDPRTVQKWLDAKLLPCRNLPSGRRIIIKAADVVAFDVRMMQRGERA